MAVGRSADLILLTADPLADIANTEHRAGVMVRGRGSRKTRSSGGWRRSRSLWQLARARATSGYAAACSSFPRFARTATPRRSRPAPTPSASTSRTAWRSRAKETAREQAFALLAGREPTPAEVSLRVNDVKTEPGRADLAALVEAGVRPDALMLPKVAGAGEVREVEAALARLGAALPLIVQLETAAGVLAAEEIAAASPNVSAVFFGAIDLSADLGCAVAWEALLYARSRVVLAAGAAGVSALDSPFMDVPAVEALADESRRVRRLGFAGKAAIHPTQVPVIQRAFSPSDEELAWARKIVAAYEEAARGRAAGRRPAHRAPGHPRRAPQPADRRPARGRRRSGPLRPGAGRLRPGAGREAGQAPAAAASTRTSRKHQAGCESRAEAAGRSPRPPGPTSRTGRRP